MDGDEVAPRRISRVEAIGGYAASRDVGGAEILAYDPDSARLFVTSANAPVVDVLDLGDPSAPTRIAQIDLSSHGGPATSVDVADGVLAIAVPADPLQDPGSVVFVRAADLELLAKVSVGALPDMLSFSPDSRRVIVACEGEPTPDYHLDPEATIAIIDLRGGFDTLDDADVRSASFAGLDPAALDPRIRVRGPGASLAQDLEPEFLTIAADSKTAWVSLQENNALAIVDLDRAAVTDVIALGEIPHPRLAAHPQLAACPIGAMRQPDGIASAHIDGRDYVVTANEGECRDYPGLQELAAVRDLPLDPAAFPDAETLQRDDVLGTTVVSRLDGDLDHDGDYDELHTCGSRSVSIWSAAGELVWDSGALLQDLVPVPTNAAGLDEGSAPEGVVVADLWGRTYAFVSLEWGGGVVVFDITDPAAPEYLMRAAFEGDVAPEGLEFVAPEDSPTGEPLLLVAHEISDSVRVFRIL